MNKLYRGSKFYINEEISIILKDLFDYFKYTNFEIDDELKGIRLTGYVPIVEMREALRLIAEAGKCVVNKTRYGKTYIFKTYDSTAKTFDRREIFNESPSKNLFNNTIDVVEYGYSNILENQELFNANFNEAKEYNIEFVKSPVLPGTIKKSELNDDYEIIKTYSTSCLIRVLRPTKVVLKGDIFEINKKIIRVSKKNLGSVDDYAINKVDNHLITNSNSNEVALWKLQREEVRYQFDTPVTPYIEVGDTCEYKTRFNTTNKFIPTRLEFTKSIVQNIEGE